MTKDHPQNKYKAIELLRYALDKENVYNGDYGIRLLGDTALPVPEKTYLEELEDDNWRVYYLNRNKEVECGNFGDYHHAVDFFFWCLVDVKSLWDYREQWEYKTGQEFLRVF